MPYTNINKSTNHFGTQKWGGNGSSQDLNGLNFKPSFQWIKNRSRNSYHTLVDAIRGTSYVMSSHIVNAHGNDGNQISSFNTNGFSVGSSTNTNASGENLVGWSWKGNDGGVSNTNGSVTSTVSADATAGFSIVKWTGTGANATIGHGLGSPPAMIICFGYSSGGNSWTVGHNSIGWTKHVYLETGTDASSATSWNNTAPTNDVFSVGSFSGTNSSQSMIAYCFSDRVGFSKVGHFFGTGSTLNSPFIFTGHKPAFVLIKGVDSGGSDNWGIVDNIREGYNSSNKRLYANAVASENSTNIVDLLSNGFKVRVSSTDVNASGKKYIYYSVAEAPLVGSNNVPATAR